MRDIFTWATSAILLLAVMPAAAETTPEPFRAELIASSRQAFIDSQVKAYNDKTAKDPDAIPRARSAYETATKLDPNNKDAWFDLGFLYKADHKFDEAAIAFQKYLDLNKGTDAAGQKSAQEELSTVKPRK
mgnify:CR=1 FL=1